MLKTIPCPNCSPASRATCPYCSGSGRHTPSSHGVEQSIPAEVHARAFGLLLAAILVGFATVWLAMHTAGK